MRKECRKVRLQERGTKPWTILATLWHSAKTERSATRIEDQPPEKRCLPTRAFHGNASPTETQREDAIRLRQQCLPANTTRDAGDSIRAIAPADRPPHDGS